LPIVAIGGITVENAPELIAAGADSVAVISALFSATDIQAAAQRFSALFAERK
jgi:thiamine-phosphate pyrophosphorylase